MSSQPTLYQRGYTLSFPCVVCGQTVPLPLLELEERGCAVGCPECCQNYCFADAQLQRQLHKFEKLCRQIRDSEEVLSEASVGVDVGPHQVKIPFKLLLTRLNTTLELMLGEHRLVITFRTETSSPLASKTF